MQTRSIGGLTAILLCVNSIIGAGVFVNIKSLFGVAAFASPIVYLVCAAILLPIVWTMLKLASARPVAAGLFVHTQEAMGSYAAFVSTWAYFLSKATSAAIMTSFFVQSVMPELANCCWSWSIKAGVILLIATFNIIGLKLGGRIQYIFTLIKFTAFLCISGAWVYLYFLGKGLLFEFGPISSQVILGAVPTAIYSLTGFEILVTLAHQIKHPELIHWYGMTAFSIAAIVCFCIQSCALGIAGNAFLMAQDSIAGLSGAISIVSIFVYYAMALSIKAATITSAFSLLTNNCWNLRAMAQLLPFGNFLLPVNKNNVPYVALIIEGLLAILVTTFTSNLSALGSMFAFSTSVSFLFVCFSAGFDCHFKSNKRTFLDLVLQKLSVISCLYLLYKSCVNILGIGLFSGYFVIFFGVLIIAGLKQFLQKKQSLV